LTSIRTLRILPLLLLLAAQRAEARGPSTLEERNRAIGLVHLLETEPLHNGAQDARAWLLQWLIEIPDITVTMCPELLGPGFDSGGTYGPELTVQQGFSAAAFIIEHPDQASNDLRVDTASVKGVLRAYQAILVKHPEARSSPLDELLEAQRAGELAIRISRYSKECRSNPSADPSLQQAATGASLRAQLARSPQP
jgi:hypothetical protein